MKRTYLLTAIVSILTMTSCEVQKIEFITLESVQINRIEKNELYLDVTAVLDNPNDFNIKVIDTDLDLYLSNRYIGKSSLEKNFTIEGGKQKAYELEIMAKGENLNAELLPVMLSAALTGSVNVGLKGDIKGKVLIFTRSVNVDIEERVEFSKQTEG